MLLKASQLKNLATTLNSIDSRLSVIATKLAGDSFKFHDEVAAALASCKNASKTCISAKKMLTTQAITTVDHLIAASADKTQLFDKALTKVIALEARAQILASIIANTYEGCDMKSGDTDPDNDGDDDTNPATDTDDDMSEIFSDDMSDEDSDEDEMSDYEESEDDMDLTSEDDDEDSEDDMSDDEDTDEDSEDDMDLTSEDDEDSDEDDGEIDETEDDESEDETTPPVTASAKKPQTGSSRNALKRTSVTASKAKAPTESIWSFK